MLYSKSLIIFLISKISYDSHNLFPNSLLIVCTGILIEPLIVSLLFLSVCSFKTDSLAFVINDTILILLSDKSMSYLFTILFITSDSSSLIIAYSISSL